MKVVAVTPGIDTDRFDLLDEARIVVGEAVDAGDLGAAIEQRRREMRSDETRPRP